MGPGHLVLDPQAVLERLEAEWADVEGDADAPLTEPLGNGLCRLSLAACKGQGLDLSLIHIFRFTLRGSSAAYYP